MASNRGRIQKTSASRPRRGSNHIAQAGPSAVLSYLGQDCLDGQWHAPIQSPFPSFREGAVGGSQHSFPSHQSTHPSASFGDRASSLISSYTAQLDSRRGISYATPSTETSSPDGNFGEVIGNAPQFEQPSPANAELTLRGISDSSHYPQGYRFSSPTDTAAPNDGLYESGHVLQGAQCDRSRWISASDAPKAGSSQGPWNVCALHHLGDSHASDVIEEGLIFRREYISTSGNLEPIHNISQWTQNTNQDWIRAQHSSADAQLPWQKAPTQSIWVENESPHDQTHTPACSASFASPQSSPQEITPKPGRMGPLTDFGRENARKMRVERTCFRCFFMKEQCVMQPDGICKRCRELGNKLRTWELPCTRVGLDKRAKYMLPDVLVTQLKGDRVEAFVMAHVTHCVPGSSLKLSLTLGSGTPLRFDAVEAFPRGKKATQMLSFRLGENGTTVTAELKSPPILPYMADRDLIIRSANLWIDSMIRECDSDFVQNYLPESHERYEREILSIVCQYHRDHIRELEASGEGPYQTLRWALKMTALNFIMGRPLVVPEDEVEALSRQLQHYQLEDTDEWICPRLTNRIIKHMLLPLLDHAVKRVLTDLSSSRMLRAKGGEEAVWDQAFCIMVLCLLVVGKTQASLIERAEVGRRNDDHSFSFHDAKSAINEMEIELSKHLIGMFHSRFGTAKARTGKGRPFNPLARDAGLRPNFDSSLAKQVRSATNAYGSKILEAVDFKQPDPQSMKKMNVTRLLANFLHPFFYNSA